MCRHRGVNGEKIVITQHSVPELIPTPAASRLIGSGYAPLQHTQSACLWALGLTSAPLGLSRHMAGQRARALLAHASLCTTSSRAAATARQCDRHNTQQAGLRSSHFAPLARSLLIIVVATSEYASVTPHHSLLIIHHGDPIPWPFRGSPSSYGPPASCRLGQGEAAWPNTCVLVSY